MDLFSSLSFWVLLVGLIAFVLKFFFPALPLTEDFILKVVLWILAAFGIVPTLRARGLANSMAFWTLLVGLVVFVVKFFWPAFPLSESFIMTVVLFVLGLFGIVPALRSRGLLK
jgi:uncharacterized membrane protein YqjE